MTLLSNGPHCHVLEVATLRILFSYGIPVAKINIESRQAYKTEVKHSQTTSKHVNAFFAGKDIIDIQEMPESFFHSILRIA